MEATLDYVHPGSRTKRTLGRLAGLYFVQATQRPRHSRQGVPSFFRRLVDKVDSFTDMAVVALREFVVSTHAAPSCAGSVSPALSLRVRNSHSNEKHSANYTKEGKSARTERLSRITVIEYSVEYSTVPYTHFGWMETTITNDYAISMCSVA